MKENTSRDLSAKRKCRIITDNDIVFMKGTINDSVSLDQIQYLTGTITEPYWIFGGAQFIIPSLVSSLNKGSSVLRAGPVPNFSNTVTLLTRPKLPGGRATPPSEEPRNRWRKGQSCLPSAREMTALDTFEKCEGERTLNPLSTTIIHPQIFTNLDLFS